MVGAKNSETASVLFQRLLMPVGLGPKSHDIKTKIPLFVTS